MLPDMKLLKRIRGAMTEVKTVLCCHCKAPLWELHNVGNYHTTRKVSLGQTPAWSEFWSKDGKTPLKLECPYCSEHYFKVIKHGDTIVPKLHVLELDEGV